MKKIKENITLVSGEQQTLDIPDQPGHYYALQKTDVLATDAQPPDAQGVSLLYNRITWYITFEGWDNGKEFVDHGYAERTMPNGDRILYKFDGQSGEEEIISGTGKFKNIKGHGKYKGDFLYEGLWQGWHEWEYEIG